MVSISAMGDRDAAITTTGCVLFLSGAMCLLLHNPRKPTHQRLLLGLGWAGFVFRLAHCMQIGMLEESALQAWADAHKNGFAYLTVALAALFDQTVTLRTLPGWLNVCLRALHGLIFATAAFSLHRYAELCYDEPWWYKLWRQMIIWGLPQVCIFLPYHLLTKLRPPPVRAKQQRTLKAVEPGSVQEGMPNMALTNLHATARGKATRVLLTGPDSAAAALGKDGSKQISALDVCHPPADHSGTMMGKQRQTGMSEAAPGLPLLSPAGSGHTADGCDGRETSHLNHRSHDPHTTQRGAAGTWWPHQLPAHPAPRPPRQAGPLNFRPGRTIPGNPDFMAGGPTAFQQRIQSIRAVPYTSKLGLHHKACLKINSDLTCSTLPADLQQALQDALQHIQGSAVRITEMAVRPGCVMITMTLASQHPGDEEALEPSTCSSPAGLGEQVAAALLPITQQLLQCQPSPGSPQGTAKDAVGGVVLPQAPETKHAVLQVGDVLFAVEWDSATSTWQLQPATQLTAAAAVGHSSVMHVAASEVTAAEVGTPVVGTHAEHDTGAEHATGCGHIANAMDVAAVGPQLGLVAAVSMQKQPTPGHGMTPMAAGTSVPAVTQSTAHTSVPSGTPASATDNSMRDCPAGSRSTKQGSQGRNSTVQGSGGSQRAWMQVDQGALTGDDATQARASSWQLTLDCQIWHLPDKLAEVTGWEAPEQSGHSLPQQTQGSIAGVAGALAAGGVAGPWQILVRSTATGTYLTTHVQGLVHKPVDTNTSLRLANATVLVELPDACLFHHHPGSSPSSLLLLTTELWQHNTLISSSPVLAINPSIVSTADNSAPVSEDVPISDPSVGGNTPTASSSMVPGSVGCVGEVSSWWWGARSTAVTKAVLELTGAIQGLAVDPFTSYKCIPSFVTFMTDVGVWLEQVQQAAVLSGHCTSCSARSDPQRQHPIQQQHTPAAHDSGSEDKNTQLAHTKQSSHMQPQQRHASSSDLPSGTGYQLKKPGVMHPLKLLQEVYEGLSEHAARLHMWGLQSMIMQQWVLLKQQTSSSSVSNSRQTNTLWSVLLPVWLQPSRLREVLCGHTCHMCEEQYKQGLLQMMLQSRASLNGAVALVSGHAALRAVRGHSWTYVRLITPWFACHILAVLGSRFGRQYPEVRYARPQAPAQGRRAASNAATASATDALTDSPATAAATVTARSRVKPQIFMYLIVCAYLYRITCNWLLVLRILPSTPTAALPMLHNLLVWVPMLSTYAVVEQLQASTILSARQVASIAGFLDLPSILLRTIQELSGAAALISHHHLVLHVVLRSLSAPLVVLAARMVADAWLRQHILYAGRSAASRASSLAACKAVTRTSSKPGTGETSTAHGKEECLCCSRAHPAGLDDG